MIKATVPGKIGKDAEVKTIGANILTEFSVATDDREKVNGQWEKATVWVKCTIWGDRGQKLAQYLTKGTSVTAFGSLAKRDYVTKDGKPGSSLELRVDDVVLQGSKRDSSAEDKSGGNYDRTRGNSAGNSSSGQDDFAGGDFGNDSDIPF